MYDRRQGIAEGHYFRLQGFTGLSTPNEICDALAALGSGDRWYRELKENGTSHKDGVRQAIFLSNLLSAMKYLQANAPNKWNQLENGARRAMDDLLSLLCDGRDLYLADDLYLMPEYSPHILHNIAEGLNAADRLWRGSVERIWGKAPHAKQLLAKLFSRSLEELLSRFAAGSDYDPIALAFVLRGSVLIGGDQIHPKMRLFAIDTLASAQNKNGTWPDGGSAFLSDSSIHIQQPSVKVAVLLAQTIFRHADLVTYEGERHWQPNAMLALDRFARFLMETYVKLEGCSGWVSDRVRWPSTVETWITGLAVKFWFYYLNIYRARDRNAILAKYGASRVDRSSYTSVDAREKRWQRKVIEPDNIVRPCKELEERVLRPCLNAQRNRHWLVKPGITSIIIYGPPGSGKTFFVSELAAALGWPLLTLTPGHFVCRGLEMIETQAREVFEDLLKFNHGVVLFDECDQLFRDRDADRGSRERNILSFLTASMLPKLQQMNDEGRILMALATNYLADIDPAIRRPGRFDSILLFDRPDADGCLKHLCAEVTGLKSGEPVVAEGDETMKKMARACAGLTVKEIRDIARTTFAGGRETGLVGTLNEYHKWITCKGRHELDADTSISSQAKQAVILRWALYTGYDGGIGHVTPEEWLSNPENRGKEE